MSILDVKGVDKKINEQVLLNNIEFRLEKGEKFGIVGETGSGKTTLLKIIAGLLQSTSGEVLFKNKKVPGPEDLLVPGHSKIGYLSQHFELPKFITVEDHIFDSYKISEEDVDQLYAICDIKHLIHKDTQHLSGGEKQRVALARILRDEPELLLLDEPFSNLDLNHRSIIQDVLSNLEKVYKNTLIMVSHDPQDVLSWADRIFVMKSGSVIQSGDAKELYYKPKDEYVAGLFGDYNLIDPKLFKINPQSLHIIDGHLFFRPSQVSLTKNGEGLTATVQDIKFMGSYNKVYVKIKNQQIVVDEFALKWEVNQQVNLALKIDN